jgi:hypothetical protein
MIEPDTALTPLNKAKMIMNGHLPGGEADERLM